VVYEAGIPVLMCRVRLFLLDVSELAILFSMCSLLTASIEWILSQAKFLTGSRDLCEG